MAISVLNMLLSRPLGTQVALILLVDRSMDEKHSGALRLFPEFVVFSFVRPSLSKMTMSKISQ